MKKFFLFIFVAFISSSALFAQDIIILKNGEEVNAKVLEIGTDNVTYKKYGNPNSPTYTIMKPDIFMIKYENGDKDVFTSPGAQQPTVSNQTEQADVDNGYAQTTPPFAASTKIWIFGDQTWSDAIQIPECNKESFTNSLTAPHCRSYTDGANTWYYYNWSYVIANETYLCPSPWRLPSRDAFRTLVSNTDYLTLLSAWGYGGRAYSSAIRDQSGAFYWSSSERISDYAWGMNPRRNYPVRGDHYKYQGFQVRCVK
jgi:hypothetical protein